MSVRRNLIHRVVAVALLVVLAGAMVVLPRAVPASSLPPAQTGADTANHPPPAQRVVPPIPLLPQKDLDWPLNILLMGADSRVASDPGRADAIILMRLEPATRKVRLLSLPRDTRVTVPGHGVNKLNQASSGYWRDGGTALLVKTITTDLLPGLTVDYTVKTDFAGFAAIIDALGGVTIDVEERMYYKASDIVIDLQPGVQHLDGAQALGYARFRMDAVGDFGSWGGQEHGRVMRQKKLIAAVLDQTRDVRTLLRLPAVIRAVRAAVTTDMPFDLMAQIGMTFRTVGAADVETVTFPGVPKYVDGLSYVIPDTAALKAKVGPLFGIPAGS
jgi:LCP family protein required for cell wall assembly